MKPTAMEAELLKDVYGGEKGFGEAMGISENRLKRCWHAIGKVLRHQVLELLGERWMGGGVLIGCIGCWTGVRLSQDAPPLLKFYMTKAYADAYGLRGDIYHRNPGSVRELDVFRIEAITHIPHEKVLVLAKALFTRLGELAQGEVNITLPHMGRFSTYKNTLAFTHSSDLLQVTNPARSATPAHHPEQKVISSVQQWLRAQDSPAPSAVSRSSRATSISSIKTKSKNLNPTSVEGQIASARDALLSVMTSAYERREAAIAKQNEDDDRYVDFIKKKKQEAEEHEKAAALSRMELVKRTSEALNMQVSERRRRGGSLTFLKDNVIQSSLSAPLPLPQDPKDGSTEKAKVAQLRNDLSKQIKEKTVATKILKIKEKDEEVKMVRNALHDWCAETKEMRAKKKEEARNLTTEWDKQIALERKSRLQRRLKIR